MDPDGGGADDVSIRLGDSHIIIVLTRRGPEGGLPSGLDGIVRHHDLAIFDHLDLRRLIPGIGVTRPNKQGDLFHRLFNDVTHDGSIHGEMQDEISIKRGIDMPSGERIQDVPFG